MPQLHNTAILTLDHVTSKTGAWCEYIALASDWPLLLMLYRRI